ncbi:MAG TPA: amidohydrolase family protein [Acidimicrobiales bacterium]|nr:amidohydrolase family protein [Acidimicrobiales bacterium]
MGATTDRYVVISADCHGGASIAGYRPFLASRYHDDFDRWAAEFENPYDDTEGADADRNWSSERRLREMEADGVVAEVVFPNTVPPFFPKVSLVEQPPGATDGDLEQRWAGLQAHNRWLADFCSQVPGRRAGIAQIMLHDVDASVREIEWARDNGLTGGVLLPGAPPGSGVPPLYAPDYEPIWDACEGLGLPVTHHSGSAVPDMGPYPSAQMMFLLEVTWWAHRALWHLIYSGVMERHPSLQFVFTEQGTAWIPEELTRLDYYRGRLSGAAGAGGSQEARFGAGAIDQLSLAPSEYWRRQCHLGSSFIRRHEVALRDQVGVDRIMWGSDYPHLEGCWPFSRQHLRLAFAGVPEDEVRLLVGRNAADVYGFDWPLLERLADEHGPSPAEVDQPLDAEDIPDESLRCPAFAAARFEAR